MQLLPVSILLRDVPGPEDPLPEAPYRVRRLSPEPEALARLPDSSRANVENRAVKRKLDRFLSPVDIQRRSKYMRRSARLIIALMLNIAER